MNMGIKMNDKHKKAVKTAALIIFIAVMVLLTVVCLPIVPMLASEEGRARLEALVDENLLLGIVVFMFLQVLQIVVALIPGAVVQILGGVLFGGFWGTVLCMLGTLAGEVIVFYIVRWLGMPIVEALIDSKGIKKLSFLQDTKKVELAVFILFLIPVMPKDALTYIAPLTKIKPSTFFFLSMIARAPAMTMSIVFGSSLSSGHITVAILLFVIVAIVGIVSILYKDRIIDMFRTVRKTRSDNRI